MMQIKPISLNPCQILKGDADEEQGEQARLSSFVGAYAVGDLIKSTLGPKGMDKILYGSGRDEGKVEVTNDGATILRSIGVDNPAAKVLVNIAKVQDEEVGDGTTTVAVLASELLKEAEVLVNKKFHPQTIIDGWRESTLVAKEALEKSARPLAVEDPELFRAQLTTIAKTTLSSKIISQSKELFAKLCVDAILRLKGSMNLDSIQIIKKLGGALEESFLDEGFLLDKIPGHGQPRRVENAKILIANTPMDTDKIKVFASRVKVDSVAKVAELELAEKEKMKDKVNLILQHNVNVFINRQLIYNFPEQLFADANVMAIEHADFDGIERLALVTGGEIVSTFGHPDQVRLGTCELIEEVMIGEDKLLRFSGVPVGEACTIVLRGATQQILDEAQRSVHDVLCVLARVVKEPKIVYGGGSAEMLMANAVEKLAQKTMNKQQFAMESYASALRTLPTIIADNGGYDSSQLIPQLRALHATGAFSQGIDMNNGIVADMKDLSINESLAVKSQALVSAAEAAEMILRVNNILKSAPRKRQPDHRGH